MNSTEVVPTSIGRPMHVVADDLRHDGAQFGFDRAVDHIGIIFAAVEDGVFPSSSPLVAK